MDITTLPRELINLNLRAARLPLTAVELVARRGQGSAEWPPAIAFESAQATVRETFGGLLHDEILLADGRLQRAKVNELRHALEAKAEAVRKQAEADERYEERKSQVERQEQQAEQQAGQRQRQLEREKARAKGKVADEAARKKQAANKAAQLRQEQLEAQERDAEARRLEAESVALTEKERALAAQERVGRLDAAAKATKRARTAN